jgi:hypothetical protein
VHQRRPHVIEAGGGDRAQRRAAPALGDDTVELERRLEHRVLDVAPAPRVPLGQPDELVVVVDDRRRLIGQAGQGRPVDVAEVRS